MGPWSTSPHFSPLFLLVWGNLLEESKIVLIFPPHGQRMGCWEKGGGRVKEEAAPLLSRHVPRNALRQGMSLKMRRGGQICTILANGHRRVDKMAKI